MPRHALDEVVVAQGVGQPQVAAGPERLAGHDRHLGLLEDQRRQLGRGLRRDAADRPARARP